MNYEKDRLSPLLIDGWGSYENGFYWSINRYAIINFPIKKYNKPLAIQLTLEPFIVPNYTTEQSIEIFCNGLNCFNRIFDKAEQEIIYFEIHPSITQFGHITLNFSFPDSVSPEKLKISTDKRRLGFKIYDLSLI